MDIAIRARKENDMKNEVICPLDGKPCDKKCPDRYPNRPGCTLTTAQEIGAKIIDFGGRNVGMMFLHG